MTVTKPKHLALRALARWHRVLGLTSAVFVLLLAVTGIMINHSADLSFEKHYVSSPWLLNRYGIEAPIANEAFRAGDSWVSRIDNRLYFNEREVSTTDEALIGAVQLNDLTVVASASRLLLFGAHEELLEKVGNEHGLPEALQHIGLHNGQVVLAARAGQYRVDLDNLRWTKQQEKNPSWSEPTPLPESLQAQIGAQARSKMLTVEQVVRDAHSGRIVGAWGVWFMDAVALLFVALTATGIWMWWRAKREFGSQASSKRPKRPKTETSK